MDTALFYYTLVIMLVSILTAATCLSSYLVSRNRSSLFAFFGFFFYFFDVALVFHSDFVNHDLSYQPDIVYAIGNPVASILVSTGLLVSFWLLICEFLNERRRALLVVPGIAYAAGCIAVLVAVPPGNWQEFLFYSMRALMFFWMLAFSAFRYLTSRDDVERERLKRHCHFYAALWLLGLCVLGENVFLLLMFDPAAMASGALPFLPERNFAENALLMCCAFVSCWQSWRLLSLRFEKPPARMDEPLEAHIDRNLAPYGRRFGLSERESEVLKQVLLGRDNQNIATSLHLAVGTVKVHMHNILQKTGQQNRQELIRDFWKTS